jgi:hypothetical protein
VCVGGHCARRLVRQHMASMLWCIEHRSGLCRGVRHVPEMWAPCYPLITRPLLQCAPCFSPVPQTMPTCQPPSFLGGGPPPALKCAASVFDASDSANTTRYVPSCFCASASSAVCGLVFPMAAQTALVLALSPPPLQCATTSQEPARLAPANRMAWNGTRSSRVVSIPEQHT